MNLSRVVIFVSVSIAFVVATDREDIIAKGQNATAKELKALFRSLVANTINELRSSRISGIVEYLPFEKVTKDIDILIDTITQEGGVEIRQFVSTILPDAITEITKLRDRIQNYDIKPLQRFLAVSQKESVKILNRLLNEMMLIREHLKDFDNTQNV